MNRQQQRRPFPASLLLVAVFPIILAASVLLYRSLDQELQSEKIRDQRLMRSATFDVVDNLGFELFTLYINFSGDLYSRNPDAAVGLADIEQALDRYQTHSRFPKLLTELACLIQTTSGNQQFLSLENHVWKAVPRPGWILDRDTLEGNAPVKGSVGRRQNPILQTSFSLTHPVLSSYFNQPPAGPQNLTAVFLRFDVDVVLKTIVPNLVRQSFSEGANSHQYQVQILHKDLLMPSLGEFSDLLVPLIPWTPLNSWFDHYVLRLSTLSPARP